MFAIRGCLRSSSHWQFIPSSTLRIPLLTRSYAISVQRPRPLPGKQLPRVFRDKKAFQYNWYMNILKTNTSAPIIFFKHEDFSAKRLIKLRSDILSAHKRALGAKPAGASLAAPTPIPVTGTLPPQPTLTVIRTSIFGAALRDLPGVDLRQVEKMLAGLSGNFAVLSLPSFDPPQLSIILRTIERSVPPRPPKTPQELKAEEAVKNADPEQPGRRVKRVRRTLVPNLKLIGALMESRVFLPQGVKDVAGLPTLDTLRAQLVGLLSAPGMNLAAVLNEAGGARLKRTLEGLKKSLEEEQGVGVGADAAESKGSNS